MLGSLLAEAHAGSVEKTSRGHETRHVRPNPNPNPNTNPNPNPNPNQVRPNPSQARAPYSSCKTLPCSWTHAIGSAAPARPARTARVRQWHCRARKVPQSQGLVVVWEDSEEAPRLGLRLVAQPLNSRAQAAESPPHAPRPCAITRLPLAQPLRHPARRHPASNIRNIILSLTRVTYIQAEASWRQPRYGAQCRSFGGIAANDRCICVDAWLVVGGPP